MAELSKYNTVPIEDISKIGNIVKEDIGAINVGGGGGGIDIPSTGSYLEINGSGDLLLINSSDKLRIS